MAKLHVQHLKLFNFCLFINQTKAPRTLLHREIMSDPHSETSKPEGDLLQNPVHHLLATSTPKRPPKFTYRRSKMFKFSAFHNEVQCSNESWVVFPTEHCRNLSVQAFPLKVYLFCGKTDKKKKTRPTKMDTGKFSKVHKNT